MAQSRFIKNRVEAVEELRRRFAFLLDKEQAWKDLVRLAQDKDSYVRWRAAPTLCSAVDYIPNKGDAWEDLYRLTQVQGDDVRCIPNALYSVFPYASDKEQAFADLIRLTQSKYPYVRISTNYFLGKICISKATEAECEDDFREELEKALKFFEIVSKETLISPARFCLPFYRSFYTITFKKQGVEAEVKKYLSEAKGAVEGSKSKKKLLDAMENLANALKEVQKVHDIDFNTVKCDLNAYRRYCERAAELLETTAEKAPGATKLIKKGLPIIDQQIKEIIAEIQKNAKALCNQTKNTALEDLGKEVNRAGQIFPQIRDPIGLEKGFINLWMALLSICAKMPEEEKGEACELLKKAGDEPYIEDKLPLINMVLSKISSQISAAKNIETVEKKLDEILVSLKPGIRQELVITVGAEFAGTGAKHKIHIPLQEIAYSELKKDLENIKGKGILKLASLPAKLAEKVKEYLVRNKSFKNLS